MRYGFTPRQFLTLMEETDMKWKTVKAGDLICEVRPARCSCWFFFLFLLCSAFDACHLFRVSAHRRHG